MQAIIPTNSGCDAYPKALLTGISEHSNRTINATEVKATLLSVVAYTRIGCRSSFLLMKRKKPVSIP